MDFEEITTLINQMALTQKGRPLKDVERLVLKGAWENQTYTAIASLSVGYSEDYLKKDVGPKLWRFLSELVDSRQEGIKLNKRNLQNVLQTWAAQTLATPPPSSPGTRVGQMQIALQALPPLDETELWGRQADCQHLLQWVRADRCRLILLWGLPGSGKTSLAIYLAQRLKADFDRVGYLLLCDQTTDDQVLQALGDWLAADPDPQADRSTPLAERILERCRQSPALILIDQLEELFAPQQLAGTYRAGRQGISALLQQLATSQHRSCILCISQEKPQDFAHWSGPRVRDYPLQGWTDRAVKGFLAQQGKVSGTPQDWAGFNHRYGGLPLALKALASSLQDLYQGQVSLFLKQTDRSLADRSDQTLQPLMDRLSREERELLYWLALAPTPLSLASLKADMPAYPGTSVLQSLIARSLCRAKADPVLGDTVIDLPEPVAWQALNQLQICLVEELRSEQLDWFHRLPLITMTAPRARSSEQQQRLCQLLIQALAVDLASSGDRQQKCQRLYQALRPLALAQPGYGPANLIRLYQGLGVGLRGADFSHLDIWDGDLSQINLQGANFESARFHHTAFATPLDADPVLAISPNGHGLVAADSQGRLWWWHLTQGHLLQVITLADPPMLIAALCFSPDGETLAVGTSTGQLWLYPVAAPGPADRLNLAPSRVTSLAFTANGELLASGNHQGQIYLWEVASGVCQRHWTAHRGSIQELRFNPAGDRLISLGEDQTAYLWDLPQATLGASFQARPGVSIRTTGFFSPPGDLGSPPLGFAAGYDDYGLTLWALATGDAEWAVPTDMQGVLALAVSADGRYLACSRQDVSLTLWDIQHRRRHQLGPALATPAWSLQFSPDGTYLITGHDAGLQLWHTHRRELLQSFLRQAYGVCAMAFGAANNYLMTAHTDHQIRIWPLDQDPSRDPLPLLIDPQQGRLHALAISDDGQWWASSGADHTITLWSGQGWRAGGQARPVEILPEAATLIALSPRGEWLAAAGLTGAIGLWQVASGKTMGTLPGHGGPASALSFNPTALGLNANPAPELISGGRDGTICLWDLQQWSCRRVLRGHRCQVHSLALSLTGDRLISASYDGRVCWWDLDSGTQLGHWQAPLGEWLHTVTLDGTGQALAITSRAGVLSIWPLIAGADPCRLGGHRQDIWAAVVSSDRSRVMTISQDSEIRLWILPTGPCQQVIQAGLPYAGVNMTGVSGLSTATLALVRALGARLD
ncbi:MAG: NACHT domain-containing protein [Cyanobacteria bacterium REEB459]|nr:NACHT domain-containing protein [Cyanobacteria bacterium REEB459]